MPQNLNELWKPFRRRAAVAFACAAAVVFGIYARALNAPFFLNERKDFFSNTFFQRITSENISELLGFESRQGYFPVSQLFLAANYSFFGEKTWIFRAEMMLFHALSAWLVFLIALKLLRNFECGAANAPRGFAPAAACGLIYLFHPYAAPAVLWVGNAHAAIGVMFSLASVYCFLRARDGVPRYYTPFYFLSTLAFIAAIFSSRQAFAVPVVFAAADWLAHINRKRPFDLYAAKDYAPFLGVAAAVALLWAFNFSNFQRMQDSRGLLREGNLPLFFQGVCLYAKQYLLPGITPAGLDISATAPGEWAGAAIIAASVAVAILFRRTAPIVSLGAIWWLSFIPFLLIPTRMQLVAHSYALFGQIGITFAIFGVWNAAEKRVGAIRPAAAIAGLAVCLLAAAAWRYSAVWKDPVSYWQAVTQMTPNSVEAFEKLGLHELEAGDSEAAERHLMTATVLCDKCPRILIRLGQVYSEQGRKEEAGKAFEYAAKSAPDDPLAGIAWGTYLYENGRTEEALKALEKGKRSKIWGPFAYKIIAQIKRREKEKKERGEEQPWTPLELPGELLMSPLESE